MRLCGEEFNMSDLRSAFISRDFVVNSNIIKCISNIDISIDEFLLVLYFINISADLDTDDIKDKLGFDEEKAVNTFSSLLNKKYIEMEVINKGGDVIEKIKLDPLYDRLALNKKVEEKSSDIFAMFEGEFGRTLSPIEYEMINKWLESGVSEDTIKEALKEAILNNVRNFKYIDKIIYEWSKNGTKKRIKKEETKEELFDYDWLDSNE